MAVDGNIAGQGDGGEDHDNADIDACILGGVLSKLEQFCALEVKQGTSRYWFYCATNVALLIAFVVVLIPIPILVLATTCTPIPADFDSTAVANNDHDVVQTEDGSLVLCPPVEASAWAVFAFAILASYFFFVTLWIWIGRMIRDWEQFENRLDAVLEEMWTDLGLGASTGYSLSRKKNIVGICAWGFQSGTFEIFVRRKPDARLPPPPQGLQEASNTVDQIDMLKVLANGARESTLPVDAWVLGGLMLQLRIKRHQLNAKTRRIYNILGALYMSLMLGWFAFCVLTDTSFLILLISGALIYALVFLMPVAVMYAFEMLDAAQTHNATEHFVQNMSSTITEERHGIAMTYTVERRGGVLPKLTKGVLHFNPSNVPDPITENDGLAMVV